jgi:hypothetical protein
MASVRGRTCTCDPNPCPIVPTRHTASSAAPWIRRTIRTFANRSSQSEVDRDRKFLTPRLQLAGLRFCNHPPGMQIPGRAPLAGIPRAHEPSFLADASSPHRRTLSSPATPPVRLHDPAGGVRVGDSIVDVTVSKRPGRRSKDGGCNDESVGRSSFRYERGSPHRFMSRNGASEVRSLQVTHSRHAVYVRITESGSPSDASDCRPIRRSARERRPILPGARPRASCERPIPRFP